MSLNVQFCVLVHALNVCMYLGTKYENRDMQGERPVYHHFLNRGTRLSGIVAMTCEGVIGVYMHTALSMRQYVHSNANEIDWRTEMDNCSWKKITLYFLWNNCWGVIS